VELAAGNSKTAVLSECFRATRSSLLFGADNRRKLHRIVVTSPSPAEGKTTVACNLAISFAEINYKVLLIDADLHQPRLHEIFELPNRHGLVDLLRDPDFGNIPLTSGPIWETEIPGLMVLPAGPPVSGALNLLHSQRAEDLLNLLGTRFDMILLDSPPALQLSDARVLAQFADGVVLVLRAGRSRRSDALGVVERLSRDGAEVLGSVLNFWSPGSFGYGGYYRSNTASGTLVDAESQVVSRHAAAG